jgi:hypothetical protein
VSESAIVAANAKAYSVKTKPVGLKNDLSGTGANYAALAEFVKRPQFGEIGATASKVYRSKVTL